MEETSLKNSLLTELKCFICQMYMTNHIFQCNNGHNICASCQSALVNCMSYESSMEENRNLFLEKMANLVTFPCMYNKDGCGQMLAKEKVEAHQEACFYGPNRCPWVISGLCPWQGSDREMQAHVKQEHAFSEVAIVDGYTQCMSIKDDQRRELLFSAADESFFRVFVIKGGDFYGYVRYLGPDEKAEQFRYRMQLHSQKAGRCTCKGITATFKGPLHTSKVSEESILRGGSCFRVSHHTLVHLLNNELEVSIQTSIHT